MQIVLLAAGKSNRMGTNKLALLYNEKPILIHSLEAALAASSSVVLVTGYYREETLTILKTYHYDTHKHLHIIHNSEAYKGQFSSTLVGLNEIDEKQSCAIALSDSPLIQKEHYIFLEKHLKGYDGVRMFYQKTPGHPMLCSPTLIQEARKEKVGTTMRDFLNGKNINNIQSDDPRWVIDVDTKEAYEKLLSF